MIVLRGLALQAEAVRLAREGVRTAQIAARLGRKPGTIAAALSDARAAGLEVPYGRRGPAPGTLVERCAAAEARHRRIAALACEGVPAWKIAERVGVSTATVSSVLSRMRSAGKAIPQARMGRPRKAGVAA